LKFLQRSRGRKIDNSFDLKGIQADALSGDDEPEKLARFDTEDTLLRIELDMIVSTAKKNIAKMNRMVVTFG